MSKQAPSRMANRKQKPRPKRQGNLFVRILKWLAIAFITVLLAGLALFAWYAKDAPEVSESTLRSAGSSILFASNDKEFGTLGVENRIYVSAKDIPQTVKDAVISIEDRRFYKEKYGVDPIRIVGAFLNNVTGKSAGLQGGSTLTQELIKLSVFSTKASDQTLRRKAQEAWLAMQVAQKYSKSQILEYYINKVWMDNNQYGLGTAAKSFYGKSLKQLTVAQSALLAGMLQLPAAYNPYTHPQAAKARRDTVIDAMLRDKKISQAQAATAKATAISAGLQPQKTASTAVSANDKLTDSYMTSVIAEVKKKMNVNPYTANLKIYTNIDMDAQKRLYNIVNSNDYISFPNNKLQTAVTMTDPDSGKVIAQIGGRKTGNVQLGFNRATRNTRSNGSTMKPLMDYGPAIEYLNYSTYQLQNDTAYTYAGTNKQLYDWDKKYQGTITMRKALVGSRNIPAVRTLEAVGMTRATNFLKGLGITLAKNEQYLSSGIGASVTTEQEAGAYGAFANGGTYYKPYYVTKVVAADGTVTKFDATGSRAMKSSTAYMITDMLKGVLTDPDGTGSAASTGLHEAGKTGTTDYTDEELAANPALTATGTSKDSWFTGYTNKRVISVWTGYDKPTYAGLSYTEQEIAQQIYKSLMTYEYQHKNLSNTDWTKPSSVLVERILSGSNPGTAVTGNTSGTTRELYVKGYGPSSKTAVATSSSASSRSSQSSQSSQSQSSESSESTSSQSASSIESFSSSASIATQSSTTSASSAAQSSAASSAATTSD